MFHKKGEIAHESFIKQQEICLELRDKKQIAIIAVVIHALYASRFAAGQKFFSEAYTREPSSHKMKVLRGNGLSAQHHLATV